MIWPTNQIRQVVSFRPAGRWGPVCEWAGWEGLCRGPRQAKVGMRKTPARETGNSVGRRAPGLKSMPLDLMPATSCVLDAVHTGNAAHESCPNDGQLDASV